MAEFSEVMRQFDRMCKAHAGCLDCPLAIKGSVKTKCSIGSFIDESEYVEREVMAWAAEHPEPVYPTWWKYLCMIGVIPDELGDKTLGEMTVYSLMNTHIQSYIAQKLEIPKEGV